MEFEEAFKNVIVTAMVISLIPIGYFLLKATKKRMKTSLFGHLAIGVDSLITGNPEKIKEMKATVKNRLRRQNPQNS